MDTLWKSSVVSTTSSSEEALRVLDASGLRIVLVLDPEGRLVGVVTDGDIRRALLNRLDFSMPVTHLMNAHPLSAPMDTRREVLRQMMEERSLLHIPLLDDAGCVVALETLQDLLHARIQDNWVFLMAGGFGTRLRPLTDSCPKPLLPVGGKPILESIIESFIAAGFRNFLISVHYLADHIKDYFQDGSRWNATIRYIEEETPLGTGGALGLLPTPMDRPIVMMNGDVLTRLDFNALLDFHLEQRAKLTLCVREYDMQVPFGVVQGEDSCVTGIVEKPVHRFFVNAGVYVVAPETIARAHPPRRLDMPDLVNQLLADGEKVAMFPIHEYWLDIGRPDDFERAQVGMVPM